MHKLLTENPLFADSNLKIRSTGDSDEGIFND